MRKWMALFVMLAPGAMAQAPPTWPSNMYNPTPLPDDLVLPMPCGGAMTFRRIDTPTGDGALDDRPVMIGSADPETGHAEYLRRDYLVGPFGGGPQLHHFFMAKYEATRAQIDVLRNPQCPATNAPASRLPAVDLSWFEAMDAAQRYSTFLLRHARAQLPRRGQAHAFVRLPTEQEWEYAARGGAAVSEAEFQERTFPMPEGIEAYAWFQGPRSAAGRLSAIGMRRPNPLGLHDMLGNAAEWVLDPFRLNRVGRNHGLAGGSVARGGDFRTTTEGQLRSSLRAEYPLFVAETGEPARFGTVGTRFVLAAAVQSSLADVNSFREAFQAESRARAAVTSDDPAALLEALRVDQTDPATLAALDRLGAAYARQTRERSDQARIAFRARIQAAAALARGVFLANFRVRAMQEMIDHPDDYGGTAQDVAAWRGILRAVETEMEGGVRAYAATIDQLAATADVSLSAEIEIVQQELRTQRVPELARPVALVARHVERGRSPQMATLRREILNDASGR